MPSIQTANDDGGAGAPNPASPPASSGNAASAAPEAGQGEPSISADPAATDPPKRPVVDPLRGLAWLLVLQLTGEGLARGLHLPFPGPVVGMLLLMPLLSVPAIREPVALCADFLLKHLSLLFVPVGVGVMTHLDLLEHFGGRMLLVIVVSTWAGIVTTTWVLRRADRQGRGEVARAIAVDQVAEAELVAEAERPAAPRAAGSAEEAQGADANRPTRRDEGPDQGRS